MLFKFIAAAGVCQSLAVRPELSRVSISSLIAKVGNLLSDIANPNDSLGALKEASATLAQIGNATEHMSDDDEALLESVITLVETTIYGSMDSAAAADLASLNAQIDDVTLCNTNVAARQAGPDGDLYQLQQTSVAAQQELDGKKSVVDQATEANNTQWTQFDNHMKLISDPPACTPLPAKTVTALDPFFEESAYTEWFTLQQEDFQEEQGLWKATDAALTTAINEYNTALAVRDADYCDYSIALTAGCADFDTCYATEANEYSAELVPRVEADMTQRQETFKAGETLVHQIKYLLGQVSDQTTPAISVARYEMTFPVLPEKGTCDLTPLDDPAYEPAPTCSNSGGPAKTVGAPDDLYADLLISETLKCTAIDGQDFAVAVADEDGAIIKTGGVEGSNYDFAVGKVNWLVSNNFDTDTLCQTTTCAIGAVGTFQRTGELRAQGGVVLLNAADGVVGVVAGAGYIDQMDDRRCIRQGAQAAGFTAKDDTQMQFYLPN